MTTSPRIRRRPCHRLLNPRAPRSWVDDLGDECSGASAPAASAAVKFRHLRFSVRRGDAAPVFGGGVDVECVVDLVIRA